MDPPERLVVLDAWAVVAAYEGAKPATGALNHVLDTGASPIISAVNFAEVCDVLGYQAGWLSAAGRPEQLLDMLIFDAPDERTAAAAGWIKHAYRMSLADAFAAATAMAHDADLWTGDPELLCSDRLWHVLDLRAAGQRAAPGPALRDDVAFKRAEAASVVASALHRTRGIDPLGLNWQSPP